MSSDSNVPGTQVMGMQTNTYCMLLHLSQFAGYIIPFGGLAVPVVLWIIGKDKDPLIDQHGKNVLNWIISMLIYAVISGILCLLLVGFLLLLILVVLDIVFPIMGAVKANNGEVWKYPLSIPFFK